MFFSIAKSMDTKPFTVEALVNSQPVATSFEPRGGINTNARFPFSSFVTLNWVSFRIIANLALISLFPVESASVASFIWSSMLDINSAPSICSCV